MRKINPDGSFGDVVAGSGNRGGTFEPDNIIATEANLAWPTGLALGPDGSLYIADRGAHKIRKVSPGPDGTLRRGLITTVAGTGRSDYQNETGYSPEGQPATQEPLNSPSGVAVAPDGTIYIADSFNSRIRRVDPSGNIFSLAGTGSYGDNGDNIGGSGVELFQPSEVKVGPDGNVYFADTGNAVIRRIDRNGNVSIVAGSGGIGGFAGDGGQAVGAQLNGPDGFAFGPGGTLYIADTLNNRIRRVTADGVISTVVGTGAAGEGGDGGPATAATLRAPRAVSVDNAGNIYIADTDNNRIRMVGAQS